MLIYVTGASGFIGTALVRELLDAGHHVIGMTRSEDGAQALRAAGAEVHHANLDDPASVAEGVGKADAVAHLAFNHDFSKFAENGETERRVIDALSTELAGSNRLLVVTSGIGMAETKPGELITEDNEPRTGNHFPRTPELSASKAAEKGVRIGIVRLPQVHDTRKQGLITPYIQIVREKGFAAYIGDGQNRWPAAHVSDTARLYRLALEKTKDHAIYNSVAEEGVTMRSIAETIARGMKIPAKGIPSEDVPAYFGWLGMFAGWDMPASSDKTRSALGWNPTGPGLIEDLTNMRY
jgi:nucleoside-diphosphate-sugar epimerase